MQISGQCYIGRLFGLDSLFLRTDTEEALDIAVALGCLFSLLLLRKRGIRVFHANLHALRSEMLKVLFPDDSACRFLVTASEVVPYPF